MLLKRFNIRYIMAAPALALIAGLSACSSDDKDAGPQVQPKTTGIALTIPVSSTRAGNDGFQLSNEQMKSLYIATYTKDGKLIEPLVKKGEISRGFEPANDLEKEKFKFDGFTDMGEYGTVISVYLPFSKYDQYKGNLQFAAVYLPDMEEFMTSDSEGKINFEIPDNLSQLYKSVEDVYLLNHPGKGSVWKLPDGKDENDIPMAGILDVSKPLSEYNPNIWSVNHPMFLNNDPLKLERAMAKIVIYQVGGEGRFTKATLHTPAHGTIMPDATTEGIWPDYSYVKAPTEVENNEMFDQSLSISETQNNKFVFYTFESLFKAPEDRNLIEMRWENVNGDIKDKTYAVKYYDQGDPNAYYWNGILRNHVYEFVVKGPGAINTEIDLKVKEWVHDRYSVEL